MTIPLRILRAIAGTHQDPRPLSQRERQMRAHILTVAQDLLAQAGRQGVTFLLVAGALRVSAASLRRHFACMDDLFHTILLDHLDSLFAAIAAVPATSPELYAARRQAYRTAIEDGDGLKTAHRLLLTQAACLPYDLHRDIAGQCAELGECLAPGMGKFALMLLDDPALPLWEAEEHLMLKAHRSMAGSRQAAFPAADPAYDPMPGQAPDEAADLAGCVADSLAESLAESSAESLANTPEDGLAPGSGHGWAAADDAAWPDEPWEPPSAPRPMVAVPRTLAYATRMHPLLPEEPPVRPDLWASTALQTLAGEGRARAGP